MGGWSRRRRRPSSKAARASSKPSAHVAPSGHTDTLPTTCATCALPIDTFFQPGEEVDASVEYAGEVDEETEEQEEARTGVRCAHCAHAFHTGCEGVRLWRLSDLSQYHCRKCTVVAGDSPLKPILANHRIDCYNDDEKSMPMQVGSRQWCGEMPEWEKDVPDCSGSPLFVDCADGAAFNATFQEMLDRGEGWDKVYRVRDVSHLGMRVPPLHLSIPQLLQLTGEDRRVVASSVFSQSVVRMKQSEFISLIQSPQPRSMFSLLSLDCVGSELGDSIAHPTFAANLSWEERIWSDADVTDVDCLGLEASKPTIDKYVLVTMRGCYTDFHVDFGASSSWFYVHEGTKHLYMAPPTPANLDALCDYQKTDKTEWLGHKLHGLIRVVLRKGECVMMSSGWLHAVYSPEDSAVINGAFLCTPCLPTQIRAGYDLEERMEVPPIYRLPTFQHCHFHAGIWLLDMVKGAVAEDTALSPVVLEGTRLLVDRLTDWANKEEKWTTDFGGVEKSLRKAVENYERRQRAAASESDSEWEERSRRKKGGKKPGLTRSRKPLGEVQARTERVTPGRAAKRTHNKDEGGEEVDEKKTKKSPRGSEKEAKRDVKGETGGMVVGRKRAMKPRASARAVSTG